MGSVSLIRTAANDPQYAARVILADQNQDGEINVADVLLLQRRLLSGERYPPQAALEPVAPGTAGGMERQTSFAALIDYLIHPAHAVPGDPGQLLYVHVDHLGTPVAMTDEQGVKVWSAVYDPFGKATPNEDPDGNGQAVTLNVRFAGQYYDSETGLHQNGFRTYDPSTGRYLTSDPIGLWGGLNTYAYAWGNPITIFDSMGLAGECIFTRQGSPVLEATNNTRLNITEEWSKISCFPIPKPGRPGLGSGRPKPGALPPVDFALLCQRTYFEQGNWEREYKRGYWGVLRCYDDCGKLTDETYGFKYTDSVWQYDRDHFDSYQGDPFELSGPGIGPDDLPPLGRGR